MFHFWGIMCVIRVNSKLVFLVPEKENRLCIIDQANINTLHTGVTSSDKWVSREVGGGGGWGNAMEQAPEISLPKIGHHISTMGLTLTGKCMCA